MFQAIKETLVQPKQRPRTRPQRIGQTVHGARILEGDEAAAVRMEASDRFRSRQVQRRFERQAIRERSTQDRPAVALRMLEVESRIVEALWTESRLPAPMGNAGATRHGIRYLDERSDLYANAVQNGGWLTVPPSPAPPSAREIDDADPESGPLSWLRFLDREDAKLVTVAAGQKRGDVARNVSWRRVKQSLPRLVGLEPATLSRRYNAAIRQIVAMLDARKIIA